MTGIDVRELETEAQTLRREFDQSFQKPPRVAATDLQNFVLLQAAGAKLAVALRGMVSLERALRIVPVPSRAPAMLGVAAHGGRVLVIFDLGLLLGIPGAGRPAERTEREGAPVLQVRAGAGETLGLRFEKLLQFVQVPATQIYPAAGSGGAAAAGANVEHAGELYPLVSLEAVVRKVTAGRQGTALAEKEGL